MSEQQKWPLPRVRPELVAAFELRQRIIESMLLTVVNGVPGADDQFPGLVPRRERPPY